MKITRIISLAIVVTMILSMLIACGDKTGPADETTTAAGTTAEVTDIVGTKNTLFDTEAFKAKYEGEDVNILCWDSEHREFEVLKTELSGSDALLEGIYARNIHVSEALGVNLIWNEQDDDSGKAASMLQYVEMQADGGTPIDVIALYSRTAGLLSQKGHLLPVNYYSDYINLENSWYPDALVEETNIRGNTYYVSGDISTNLLYLTYGFIFNKDVLDANPGIGYTSADLYKLVEEGKWTLEEMYKLVGSYWVDYDENGVKSTNDSFGLRSYNYHLDAFYVGSGMKYVVVDNATTDPSKLIQVAGDYSSQKAIDLADDLGELMASNYAINDESCAKNFANTDRDLSFVSRVRDIQKIFDSENNDMSYGVLPIPKYDAVQADYKCVAGNPLTLWGISADSVDHDREVMAAAVIELSGYYAQTDTTEAIFETLFKGRYSEFPEDADSFDIIRRTTSFDIGRIFTKVLSSSFAIADQWSSAAAKTQKWSAKLVSLKRVFDEGAKQASNDFWNLKDTLLPTPAK